MSQEPLNQRTLEAEDEMAEDNKDDRQRLRRAMTGKLWLQVSFIALLLIVITVLGVAAEVPDNLGWLITPLFVLLMIGCAACFMNWSCPSCGAYLGGGCGWWAVSFCKRCGKRLD